MLITDEYKRLNSELHKTNKNFGGKGWKRTEQVFKDFILKYGIASVLDYGCGKGSLSNTLWDRYQIKVHNYDPCKEEFSERPSGLVFDGIICNDVLEHVEPELLDNVLQDIRSFGVKAFHFEIGLTKSNKTLADGRNNHLIVQPSSWWKEVLEKNGFKIVEVLEDWADHNRLLGNYRVICVKND